MANTTNICEGTFLGHVVASNFDPSILMAMNITDSLLACKKFDGPDVLSRHLYLYHTSKLEIGTTTKHIYQHSMKALSSSQNASITSAQSFLFPQSTIDEMVQLTDKELGGHTAGCGPAQRSFPLALFCGIEDDDLFEASLDEARLTHWDPLAGHVAGVINLIIRGLLHGQSWGDAVNSAFLAPGLSPDLLNVGRCYHRWSAMGSSIQPGLAPSVLGSALFHISSTSNAAAAIKAAQTKDKYFCAPLVGILAGARWGLTVDLYESQTNDENVKRIRSVANLLRGLWKGKADSVRA